LTEVDAQEDEPEKKKDLGSDDARNWGGFFCKVCMRGEGASTLEKDDESHFGDAQFKGGGRGGRRFEGT